MHYPLNLCSLFILVLYAVIFLLHHLTSIFVEGFDLNLNISQETTESSNENNEDYSDSQFLASTFAEHLDIAPGLSVLELFGSGNIYEKLPYGGVWISTVKTHN